MILTTNWQAVASYVWNIQSGVRVTFYLDAKYSSQDIVNNKTYIDVRLRSVLNSGSASGSNYNFTCSYCPQVSGSNVWIFETETITSKQGQEIQHDTNGKKTLNLTANIVNGYFGLNTTLSANVELPSIPRQSSITVPNTALIGDNISIIINKNVSSYTHTLTFSYFDVTETIATKTINQVVGFTIPTNFYNYIPNSNGGWITIYCETFDGNTKIGETTSANVTVYTTEERSKPTVSISMVDINEVTKTLTGNDEKVVKGYSNMRVSWNSTPNHGSSIISNKINGAVVTSSPIVYNGLNTNVLTLSSTDSRNYTNTASTTNPLVNYIPLTLDFNAFRTSPTGSEIKVNFAGNYFNESFGSVNNTLDLSWKYRVKGNTNWLNGGTFAINTDYKIVGNTFFSGNGSSMSDISLSTTLFDYNNVYEIAIYYQDKLVNTSTIKVVPRGIPIIGWGDDYVEINGNLYYKDTLLIWEE